MSKMMNSDSTPDILEMQSSVKFDMSMYKNYGDDISYRNCDRDTTLYGEKLENYMGFVNKVVGIIPQTESNYEINFIKISQKFAATFNQGQPSSKKFEQKEWSRETIKKQIKALVEYECQFLKRTIDHADAENLDNGKKFLFEEVGIIYVFNGSENLLVMPSYIRVCSYKTANQNSTEFQLSMELKQFKFALDKFTLETVLNEAKKVNNITNFHQNPNSYEVDEYNNIRKVVSCIIL